MQWGDSKMIMKFADVDKPLVAMIQCRTAEECIAKIKRSIDAGADALGVQLCQLSREERTDEKLKAIFDACEEKPVYVTSYRCGESTGLSDEERSELLLRCLRFRPLLCDIVGDTFAKNKRQITADKKAVAKQRKLIDEIHAKGGEVLISTHNLQELSADQIFRTAKLQAEHGADVIKIVVKSESTDKLPEYIGVINKVNKKFGKPFLFLDTGACSNILRKVGPDMGTCMYLCVESHNKLDTVAQPELKNVIPIKENMKA